ncbi:MAG: hypothetical protein KDK70_27585, partial [Myxococcales bacterium]|nr:hypothetical protein [Myxococcales bacterium]
RLATAESDSVALREQTTAQAQSLAALQAGAEALEQRVAELEVAGGTRIGVPECDRYIAEFRRCIEGPMPEAARAASREALETSIDAWCKAAASEAGREALATACTAALEAVGSMCGSEGAP